MTHLQTTTDATPWAVPPVQAMPDTQLLSHACLHARHLDEAAQDLEGPTRSLRAALAHLETRPLDAGVQRRAREARQAIRQQLAELQQALADVDTLCRLGGV